MQRFQNILFFVHANRPSTRAVDRVRWLAEQTGAHVTVFGIDPLDGSHAHAPRYHPPGSRQTAVFEHRTDACRTQLDLIGQQFIDHGINARQVIGRGPDAQEILQQIQVGQHDLCIKSMDHGDLTGVWPATDLQLLQHCPVSLWLLHPNHAGRTRRLLATLTLETADASDPALNRQILEMATSLATIDHAILEVVQIDWSPEGTENRTTLTRDSADAAQQVDPTVPQQLKASLAGLVGPTIQINVHLESAASTQLIPPSVHTDDVDTVLLQAEGPTGIIHRLREAGAAQLLKHLDCSILMVRSYHPHSDSPTGEILH